MVHPHGKNCGARSDLAIGKISEIVAAYLIGGKSQSEIAKSSGASQVWVSRKLRAHGVSLRQWRHRGGPGHPSWSGGRWVHGGYVRVWVSPQDPFRAMADASGYAMEHRLVMARKLGRLLSRHETVHHIDGDRSNNADCNLQLRQGLHGKGVAMRCKCCGSTNVEAVSLEGK